MAEYTLIPFEKEEGAKQVKKLKDFLDGEMMDLVVGPMIKEDGTLGARAELFKKMELVPKEEGVISPIQAEDINDGSEKTA